MFGMDADSPKGAVGDHPFGRCLLNTATGLCLVPIPKNASVALVQLALKNNEHNTWVKEKFYNIDHMVKKYIVILRDPADRLISATNMFLTGPRMPKNFRLVPGGFYTEDCHYEKQYKFIQGLDTERVDFFYYSDEVLEHINSDYNIFKDVKKLNHTKKIERLFLSVNQDLVRLLYKEDYNLINSVRFKNVNRTGTHT